MKKIFLLIALLFTMMGARSERPVISILGDSYSTFQGYVVPDTNLVWYHSPRHVKTTDVDSMQQTWWGLMTAGDVSTIPTVPSSRAWTILATPT